MTDLREKDICTLEVVIKEVSASGGGVLVTTSGGNTFGAEASDLRLLRRAPVDLATCELPVEVSWARSYETDTSGILHHRGAVRGFVTLDNGDEAAPLLSDLRPLDAPAPAPDQSEVERLRAALRDISKICEDNFDDGDKAFEALMEVHGEALAAQGGGDA